MPLFLYVFWICVKEFADSSAKPFLGGECWSRASGEQQGQRGSEGCSLPRFWGAAALLLAGRAKPSAAFSSAQPPGWSGNLAVLRVFRCACTSLCAFSRVEETVGVEVCPTGHRHSALFFWHCFERVLACVSMRAGLQIFCPSVETSLAVVCGRWLFSTLLCTCESDVVGCVSYRLNVGCL